MTTVDPANAIIATIMGRMRAGFSDDNPTGTPSGGGSEAVRFFAGDGALPWAPLTDGSNDECKTPFLWVRLARRYRSRNFPQATLAEDMCGLPRVVVVEIGVARCSSLELVPDWNELDIEADIAAEDSWRLEGVAKAALDILKHDGHRTAVDVINPFGPQGGIVAWTTLLYVQFK